MDARKLRIIVAGLATAAAKKAVEYPKAIAFIVLGVASGYLARHKLSEAVNSSPAALLQVAKDNAKGGWSYVTNKVNPEKALESVQGYAPTTTARKVAVAVGAAAVFSGLYLGKNPIKARPAAIAKEEKAIVKPQPSALRASGLN